MRSVESCSGVGVLWFCDQKKCFEFWTTSDEAGTAPMAAKAATASTMPRISLRIVPFLSSRGLPGEERSNQARRYGLGMRRVLVLLALVVAPVALAAEPGLDAGT